MLVLSRVFPKMLKIGKVTPIHKKGDKDNPDHFRPIAELPVLAKIFEYILKDQLFT